MDLGEEQACDACKGGGVETRKKEKEKQKQRREAKGEKETAKGKKKGCEMKGQRKY